VLVVADLTQYTVHRVHFAVHLPVARHRPSIVAPRSAGLHVRRRWYGVGP
jgi:hypothetical protein